MSLMVMVWVAGRVVKLLVAVVVLPWGLVAVARTAYDLPGTSVQRVRQLVRSGDSTPGRLVPLERTTTSLNMPLATFTTTPRSGRVPVAPSGGVIVTRGAPAAPRTAAVPANPAEPSGARAHPILTSSLQPSRPGPCWVGQRPVGTLAACTTVRARSPATGRRPMTGRPGVTRCAARRWVPGGRRGPPGTGPRSRPGPARRRPRRPPPTAAPPPASAGG